MDKALIFLAAIEGMDLLNDKPTPQYSWTLKNILVLVTASLIFAIILFSLVYYVRYGRKSSQRSPKPSEPRPVRPDDESEDRVRVRKKRRERIREHRPRNPTLQETGGLPPIRPDDQLPKV